MKTIRSFPIIGLLLLSITILAACGAPATQAPTAQPIADSGCAQPSPEMEVTSKELNLFTWTEYIPEEIINCFEEAYGITINHDTFSSQGEMFAKVSRDASGYDVVQPSDDTVQLMTGPGLLEKLDHSQLTVMANFSPAFLNPAFDPNNQYSLPYQSGSTGIVYNADAVKNPPTSYADLWNSEYAGRIIMVDDSRSIIGITLLSLGYEASSTDPKQLAEAKSKLKELVPNIRIFDSDSPKNALIGGDADLGVIWSTEAFLANAENASIQYIYPKEGVLLWQDNFAIMKAASHMDAAYAWFNYLYQPDVFWMVMRDHPGANPNAAAVEYAKMNQPEIYAAYVESNITNVPEDAMTSGHWLRFLADISMFDQLWTEVKR